MDIYKKLQFLKKVSLQWYGRRQNRKTDAPVQIFFALTDHYEPGTGGVSQDVEIARVDELLTKYPVIADRHKDGNGRCPRRTWFFPPHYHRYGALNKLVSLCSRGYGEIELHLHHGTDRPDSPENLEATIRHCVSEYRKFGIFGQVEGVAKYGFIHGNWALDNSRGGQFCGVNNEIDILRRTGCYADFTHPSLPESTPSQMNSIYYAVGADQKAKSYNAGAPARVGLRNEGLLMVQGPLHPFFKTKNPLSLRVLGDAIDGSVIVNGPRIDMWIKAGIGVVDKSDWVFIKTHTHGATDAESVLGDEIEYIFDYLESNYNDGDNFVLQYVTAREMYNLIRAAEDCTESIEAVNALDYEVSAPKYECKNSIVGASDALMAMVEKTHKN